MQWIHFCLPTDQLKAKLEETEAAANDAREALETCQKKSVQVCLTRSDCAVKSLHLLDSIRIDCVVLQQMEETMESVQKLASASAQLREEKARHEQRVHELELAVAKVCAVFFCVCKVYCNFYVRLSFSSACQCKDEARSNEVALEELNEVCVSCSVLYSLSR